MNKKILVVFSWAAVLLWMLLIFRLSSQVAVESNGLSLGIVGWIQKLMAGLGQAESEIINHIVRKGAHFSAYMVLAALTANALRRSGSNGWKSLVTAICICVLYAVSDEIHQLFVAGRSGQPSDVAIDSLGALAGMGIFILAVKYCEKRLHRKNSKAQ